FSKHELFNPWLTEHYKQIYMPMGLTAEVVAERYKISREAQDQVALASQQRTAAFQQSGKDKEEIAPMTVTMQVTDKATGQKSQKEVTAAKAGCNPPDTTAEGLAKLPGAFNPSGSVPAGNSSQFSDGASATLVMSADRAKALGIKPMGFFRGTVFAGCEADEMGIGPVFAVPKLLKRAGLTIDDIDIVELTEAFASQPASCRDRLGISMEQLNPHRRALPPPP